MAGGKKAKKSGKNWLSQMKEIKKCNDLRVRIKTYCKRESLTQPQLAERLKVSSSQMNSFMTGSSLSQSEVYTNGMKFLKTRMRLDECSEEDLANMKNNKFVFTSGSTGHNFTV